MEDKIQKYLAGKVEYSIKELGISYYKKYNNILKEVFESLKNGSYSDELSIQLVLSYSIFSNLICKLSNNKFNYKNDDILKEYIVFIPLLKMYYKSKIKINSKEINLLNEHFNRIEVSSKR
jgi:hypothetical protein